jgi:hypothetical protein
VPVIVECILERVTNIAKSTDRQGQEFEAIDCRHPQGNPGPQLGPQAFSLAHRGGGAGSAARFAAKLSAS